MPAYEMRISDWSSDVCSSDLHSNMPGMQMPAPKKPAAKPAPRRQPAAQPRQRRGAPRKPAPPPAHAGHAGPARPAETATAPAADPHAGPDMATLPGMTMDDASPGAPAGQGKDGKAQGRDRWCLEAAITGGGRTLIHTK